MERPAVVFAHKGTEPMDVVLRPAEKADIPDLARLTIIATSGTSDALYDGLVPGVPTETLLEWRYSQVGSVKSYRHCWIAQRGPRAIGMVHAYPIASLADAPTDPRLTADRVAVLAPFAALVEEAHGSYYINFVAVYPDCRGGGIGNRLLARAMCDAQQQGFAEVSLVVFEQNSRAVALYLRLGFEIVSRRPVVPHTLVRHSGDLLLMMRRR
jgi:ribosomal protein S18 acetylase RimI-like enzyme